MSPGPYEIPRPIITNKESRRAPPPSIYERNPQRTPSGSISPNARRSSFRAYEPPLRHDYPNVYRPNTYRPEPVDRGPYYARPMASDHYTPPDHYEPSSRDPEYEFRERSNSWNPWPDRRPPPVSPTISEPWDRPRRETVPFRGFEPSDTWKQTHPESHHRGEGSSVERHPDSRRHSSVRTTPEITPRPGYAPFIPGGDRYRPPVPSREPFPIPRADTYRPRYDEPASHYSPPQLSSPVASHRREPTERFERATTFQAPNRGRRRQFSVGQADSTSFQPRSPSWSPTPKELFNKPRTTERQGSSSRPLIYDPGERHWSPAEPVEHRPLAVPTPSKSRSPSLSSIASTRVSRQVTAHNSPAPPSDPPREPTPLETKPIIDAAPAPSIKSEAKADEDYKLSDDPVYSPLRGKDAAEVAPVSDDKPDPANLDFPQSSADAKTSPPQAPSQDDVAIKVISEQSREPQASDFPMATPSQPDAQANPDSVTKSPHKSIPLTTPKELPEDSPPPIDAQVSKSHEKDVGAQQDSMLVDAPEDLAGTNVSDAPQASSGKSEPASAADSDSDIAGHKPPATSDAPDVVLAHAPPELVVDDEELTIESIPKFSEGGSLTDALRIVVMTRKLCDRQSREERVHPVLAANLATKERTLLRHDRPVSKPAELISKCYSGETLQGRMESFKEIKPDLRGVFEDREKALKEKTSRLRAEYISLHEHWLAHCAALDEQARPNPTEVEAVQPSGRTTRRSAAGLGDAVRSDLEMEQIIASLGNDDATDPTHLSLKNLAIIPDMISVTQGGVKYLYDDTNHLVRDPPSFYAPHTGIDDWTEEEKQIFLEKFAAHPKQFGIIADFLPHKTSSQCVEYYYLHKKVFIDFRKVISQHAGNKRRRRRTDKQKGNALLADIRQHDAEVHRDSASPGVNGRPTRRKPGSQAPLAAIEARKRRTTALQQELTPASTPTPEPEGRTRRRRAAAQTAKTALAADPDGDDDGTDAEPRPAKRARRTRKVVKSAAIVKDDPPAPGEDEAGDVTRPATPQWTEADKNLFLSLVSQFGDDFNRIALSMPNKTAAQISQFFKDSVSELDVVRLAARASGRSRTTGEFRHTQAPIQYPGSGLMSSVNVHPHANASSASMSSVQGTMSSEGRFHANPWIPTAFDSVNPHTAPHMHALHHHPPQAPHHPSPMGAPGPSGMYASYIPGAGTVHMGMPMHGGVPPLMGGHPHPHMSAEAGMGHHPLTLPRMHGMHPAAHYGAQLLPPFQDVVSSATNYGQHNAMPSSSRGNTGNKGSNPYPVVPTVRLHP
ncbi:hypothetical protein HGRIS_011600 [Hohenbuehelia grisea]|uniref:SANT domain-containing protein n=1 Tax=Hohenbuehelia grisea TaxID=104357 RepID=A0ABR3JXU6_9AGAR